MVCRDFILPEICKPCLLLSTFQFMKLIIPYPENSKTETVLNKSYQEMAGHYSTAILPAHPRSLKDNAFVEGSVGVVSTWILAALRNRQFLSLPELNETIHEKLEAFNHNSFQKREGSWASCFAKEKLFLLSLPSTPFELAVWKVATVRYTITSV